MKFKIIAAETMWLCDFKQRLAGFRLEGVIGCVDPFVDGLFMPSCLQELLDKDGNVIEGKEDEFFSTELEWGKSQVGKYLECDDLSYSAFATHGDVSITN